MTAPRTDAGRRDDRQQDAAPLPAAGGPAVARGTGRLARRLALLGMLALCTAPSANAGLDRAKRHVAWGALAGSAQPVGALADYQWDVRPRAAWGVQALAGTGRYAAGARFWQGGTTQGLGLAGVADPAVRTRSLELLARAQVARWRNVELAATASGGRLAIDWDPDRLMVDAGGTPVTVELSGVHEWIAGAGVALALPLGRDWAWGVEVERRVFALDTAHRSGSTVRLARETFGDWNARFALSRAWNW